MHRIARGRWLFAAPVAAVATTFLLFDSDVSAKFPLVSKLHAKSYSFQRSDVAPPEQHSSEFEKMFPRKQWEENWDFRSPSSAAPNSPSYAASSAEKKKELEREARPSVSRYIYLVRHGQYDTANGKPNLTTLGREQAHLVGEWLGKQDVKFEKFTMSTMVRAQETGHTMLEEMPNVNQTKSCAFVEEGTPYPETPLLAGHVINESTLYADHSRIEAAFRRYFHRASPEQKTSTREVIVCHGNVIRYFVCRALQLPPEAWLRMTVGHTSVTLIQIHPNGDVTARYVGSIGHLPSNKVTY